MPKQQSTRFSIVSRSRGQSAVDKAAYISRQTIQSEYDGIAYYTKRQLEAASYAERMQASLDGFPTVKKIVAIRNQIGNI